MEFPLLKCRSNLGAKVSPAVIPLLAYSHHGWGSIAEASILHTTLPDTSRRLNYRVGEARNFFKLMAG